jgi:hypothetical protein
MKKITLSYGLIAGVIISGLMAITMPLFTNKVLSYSGSEVLGYVSILLSLSTIFIAVKTFRDKFNEGKVTFGKAFLIGLYISLIAGALYALTFMIIDAFSATPFIEIYRDIKVETMKAEGLSDAIIKAKMAEMEPFFEMYKNPLVKFLMTMMVEYVPVGLIVSLVTALILKKK